MISKNKPKDFKEKFEVVSCFIECQSQILLLHRQDSKPQGDTWGMPAGKANDGEDLKNALAREIMEELGFSIDTNAVGYFDKFFVHHDNYDFVYHIFYLNLETKPRFIINPVEHKDATWKTPTEALMLNLVPDEDYCIKAFYRL